MNSEIDELIATIENDATPLNEFAQYNEFSLTPRQAELIIEALEYYKEPIVG